jgi:MFS family permease
MQGVDSTLLTTAIPAIARGLDVTPLALHLAVTAYIISLAVFMPLSSWLADRIGTRRVFCGALIVFVAGSALCGMAANLPMLIAARVLQGLGGAVMTPVGRLILLRAFGAGGTLEAMSYLTLPMVLGPLLGPMLGATLVTYASWRWIFFVNLPICGLALGAALAMVPQDRPAEAAPRFDFSGFAMSAMAIVLFQFGLENLAEPALGHLASLGLFAAAVALALLYLAHARKVPHPALDLSLFSVRAYRAGVVGGGLSRIGLNASAFLLPLLLQLGFGMTPLLAGTLTAIGALGAVNALCAAKAGEQPGLPPRAGGPGGRRGGHAGRISLAGLDRVAAGAGGLHRAVYRHPRDAIQCRERVDLCRHTAVAAQPQCRLGRCLPAAFDGAWHLGQRRSALGHHWRERHAGTAGLSAGLSVHGGGDADGAALAAAPAPGRRAGTGEWHAAGSQGLTKAHPAGRRAGSPQAAIRSFGLRLFINGWMCSPNCSMPITKSSKVSMMPFRPGVSATLSSIFATLS